MRSSDSSSATWAGSTPATWARLHGTVLRKPNAYAHHVKAPAGHGGNHPPDHGAEGTGVKKLGQLRLVGKGAHIGVKKAHNGGETATGPVNDFVLYDILEMTKNKDGAGYDILKVGVNIGGDAWWTMTLRSF